MKPSGRAGIGELCWWVVLACLFGGVLVWRWELVFQSLASLALTLYGLLAQNAAASASLRAEVVEYWVAAAAWLSGSLYVGGRCMKALRPQPVPMEAEAQPNSAAKGSHRFLPWLIVFLLVAALSAPLLAPFDPSAQADLRRSRLLKPLSSSPTKRPGRAWIDHPAQSRSFAGKTLEEINTDLIHRGAPPKSQLFLMGTDDLGRDVFSRLLYGLRMSFAVGLSAMLGAIIAGCLIGVLAGMAGGWIDQLLMRVTDLFLAFPSLFLVIALVAFFGNSAMLLILVLAGTGWMGVARIVRGEALSLRDREFVQAARLLGRSPVQIARDHIVPNVLPLIVVAAVLQLSNVILAEAALSFLGLGIQPPTPSLGGMIGDSLSHAGTAWWLGLFPGAALSTVVVVINILAERLQREGSAA